MTQYDVQQVPRRFRSLCRFISHFHFKRNRAQYVSRGLLVASEGHQLRSEGAWRAVGGSPGDNVEHQGSQTKYFRFSGRHLEAPRAPKESPRDPQEHEKRAQESPKTPSRASLNPKPRFFRNRAPAEAKSRVLRVWRSVWEFKIDTERLQEKENSHLEEDSERRH